MAKVDISDELKDKIEDWLSSPENRFEIPNMKAFVNKACYYLLKLERKKRRLKNGSNHV